MAKAKLDPEVLAHLEWIGFVRPTGLVVSAPALVRAGVILDRRDVEGQRLLGGCAEERALGPDQPPSPLVPDFRAFAESVLGWSFSPGWYAGTPDSPIPQELEVVLPEYDEILRPDYAVRDRNGADEVPGWQLLVRVLDPGQDFDKPAKAQGRLEASPQSRMERLLRQREVPAGLLFNGSALRLISAPRGESSGWLDFRVADMLQTAGRPITTAMRALLREPRLLTLPRAQRLTTLLEESRKFQNEVSERLAEQVLHALYELLRGFQAANDASGGELLRRALAESPNEVYHALLTVILRLVFLLFAEERDMLPEGETYLRYYSLTGLYERLREDAALFPDTMDQRFGAWAQLLVLFRIIYDGAEATEMRLPERHGDLFDPDRFKFLEGRSEVGARQTHERLEPPLVPDGTVYRALEKLLVLDGERISYRALDVEQIGSVYETMMGFRLETATGLSVAVKSPKPHGAPVSIDLEQLLAEAPAGREKWFLDRTDRKLSESAKGDVSTALTLDELHAALASTIDSDATPDLVPPGSMVLQPSEERRRSGSHYTPRSLTEPIVKTALEPVLTKLRGDTGLPPMPAQVLDLKICDPAMGSGAFLVATCRELGEVLAEAWRTHGGLPSIPADEDELVFARRLVAQRCLYGVDRNPVAVDLAKVSLWLATLAREHAFTFLDHALRHGDSLVGLATVSIESFHWAPAASRFQAGFETMRVREHVSKSRELRMRIREAGDDVPDWELRDLWSEALGELREVRLLGDLVVAAYFAADSARERETKRLELAHAVVNGETGRYRTWLAAYGNADVPLAPFHWEIEFPEVFERENPGFDAFVGNPPFLRGKAIGTTLGERYRDYLTETTTDSNASADIVAFFFRRAFAMLRLGGTLGLIATKTISKGDTRRAGLRYVCNNGGTIYSARRRIKWPGLAAVIVSTLHVLKGSHPNPTLDGRLVPTITAFLFTRGGNDDPIPLTANANISFNGCALAGVGFTFDDLEPRATPLARLRQLVEDDPRVSERVFPYLGGEEINTSPTLAPRRYVIFFDGLSLDEAARWPALLDIVRERVKPERDRANRRQHREKWWQFGDWRPGLFSAIADKDRMLCVVFVSQYLSFSWLPTDRIVSHNVGVFASDRDQLFCVLQSRVHEAFATQLSSGLEDRPGYRPSDGFEPFPFPIGWETDQSLASAGKDYHEFRAAIMVRNDEGLTKTYNRFHDPGEHDQSIVQLRELHAAMDRSVLAAYGWHDIPTDCEFLLDFEVDEEVTGDRRRPWRYRWPDVVRDEVLARLLELNAARAREEARAGAGAARRARSIRPASSPTHQEGFFS